MRPAPLQDLLLRAALHPDLDVAARAAEQWSAQVDLDTLEFSSVQLLPMLAMRPDPLPLDERLAAQIVNVSRVTWLRTESHARAIAPAVAELREQGCDPVLMKGAALVHGHGASARLRPMFDVDVLVDPERVSEAAALLEGRGFVARDAAGLRAGEPRLLALKHGEEFTRGGGISVDLHWSALATMRRPELAASLRANAVDAQLAGAACRSLGRTDLLAVTLHHASDPWRDVRERWAGDVVLLVRGNEAAIDWELLVARGRQWRFSRQLLDAFEYMRDVAELELPASARRGLERCPTPLAVRVRSRRAPAPGTAAALGGVLTRTLEDYESEIADHAPIGARTGPGDFADFLVRRRGLTRRRDLPGDFAFAAAGRPWRTRRKLRALASREPSPRRDWPRYELGSEASFGGEAPRSEFLDCGWWFPEDFGTWSRGRYSRLLLGLDQPVEGAAELTVGLRAPLAERRPKVEIDIVVNGHRLSRAVLGLEMPAASHGVVIPPEALAGRDGVTVEFVVDRTGVPAELGLAPDPRQIGFGLGELTLSV